jgi:hypothetical protein
VSVVDLTKGWYRRIYSGFKADVRVCALSEPAEMWFWRLVVGADDFGNQDADPSILWATAVGRRKSVSLEASERYVSELIRHGLVTMYHVRGERYLHINDFEENQPAGRNGKKAKRVPFLSEAEDNPDLSGSIQVNPDSSRFDQIIPGSSKLPSKPQNCLRNNSENSPDLSGFDVSPQDHTQDHTQDQEIICRTGSDNAQRSRKVAEDRVKREAEVREVFDHWKLVMGKNSSTLLPGAREVNITARLRQGYTVEQLKRAVDGCFRSDRNMARGEYAGQGKHNDIELICRNPVKVDQFIGYADATDVNGSINGNGNGHAPGRLTYSIKELQNSLFNEVPPPDGAEKAQDNHDGDRDEDAGNEEAAADEGNGGGKHDGSLQGDDPDLAELRE